MKPVKEYKLGECQQTKLFFVVTGWYRPYLHLLPSEISKPYEEGETSRVFIYFQSIISFHSFSVFIIYLLEVG